MATVGDSGVRTCVVWERADVCDCGVPVCGMCVCVEGCLCEQGCSLVDYVVCGHVGAIWECETE